MSQIVSVSRKAPFTGNLFGNHPNTSVGTIVINSKETSDSALSVIFHLAGHKLARKDFFGKSDPFLRIYRKRNDGTYDVVHKVFIPVILEEVNNIY